MNNSEIRDNLYLNLSKYFNVDELNMLVFQLGIDVENLNRDTKSELILSLLSYAERHDKLEELIILGNQQRPNLTWPTDIPEQRFLVDQSENEKFDVRQSKSISNSSIPAMLTRIPIWIWIIIVIVTGGGILLGSPLFNGKEYPLTPSPTAEATMTPKPTSLPDTDKDGITDEEDNCPNLYNPEQLDSDQDGIGNLCELDSDLDQHIDDDDNCPTIPNPDQTDDDHDGIGNFCDLDRDGDGIENDIDNCILIANPEQVDNDSNGVGDACQSDIDIDGWIDNIDNCPNLYNPEQLDSDQDGIGNLCEIDSDMDGIDDDHDNCPNVPNSEQTDTDGNGIGDACQEVNAPPDENQQPNPGTGIFYTQFEPEEMVILQFGPTMGATGLCAYHNIEFAEQDVGKTLEFYVRSQDLAHTVPSVYLYKSLIGPVESKEGWYQIDMYGPPELEEMLKTENLNGFDYQINSSGDYIICFSMAAVDYFGKEEEYGYIEFNLLLKGG